MEYKKYIKYGKYVLLFFIIVVGFNMFGQFNLKRKTPPFILQKLESMKRDQLLLDSIGDYQSFLYYFNKNDYKSGDTLSYKIIVKGARANAVYKGFQQKNNLGKWELKKDTVIIQQNH